MTDFDILVRAMDAEPASVVPMAALADLLMGEGDPRGEGLAVLSQYGKVGLPTDGEYPRYWAYHGGFEEFVVGYGKNETLVPLSAIIDPEWHHLSLPRRWGPGPKHVPNPRYDGDRLAMCGVAHSRLELARVWAEADEESRMRMAFHTAPDKDGVRKPDVRASVRWLTEYAAKLPGAYYCSYADAEVVPAAVTFDELMRRAAEYQSNEKHWCETGRFDGFHNDHDFWSHYAVVTGTTPAQTGNFFACSC